MSKQPPQADVLIELASRADLFHSPDGTGFADVVVADHRETWPLRSSGFKRWLTRAYFEENGGAPNGEALQSALRVIEAKAHFDAPERTVFVRIGNDEGTIYIDIGDSTWRAIEIDAEGWRIVECPPVRFRRSRGMLPLPVPVAGGSIQSLRKLLNVKADQDFVLIVAWLLAALRDRGPYAIMALSGEQGSAKSTLASLLRALVDPNTSPLRSLPREDRDIFIAASNGFVIAFDNISVMPNWLSDTLCRLATGGGFATRQLHTDQEEILFDATRPIILNGVEGVVTRPDLADRALLVDLAVIPEDERRTEADVRSRFEAEQPLILGALLNGVSTGLRNLTSTRLTKMPRMADFALWGAACETAFWPAGTFMAAYGANLATANDTIIDNDVLSTAVLRLMTGASEWKGSASVLYDALSAPLSDTQWRDARWPKAPNALSGKLKRIAPPLRKVGINIEFPGRKSFTREIVITGSVDNGGKRSSSSSRPSWRSEKANGCNGMSHDGLDDDHHDDLQNIVTGIVTPKPLHLNGNDDDDDHDDVLPSYSGRARNAYQMAKDGD
jgi:hypothetical protein